ncbi:AMP-binding protein [Cohnella boryungensis]|uniref:AMP-binding protein n=2 Tax=Cohnella boryungensis TaxID=768479 RepID=A0ABV8S956_9BACL
MKGGTVIEFALKVDETVYRAHEIASRSEEMVRLKECRLSEGGRVAAMLRHPADVLAAIQYTRASGASLLLLHGDTPLAAAIASAASAGCSALVHGSPLQALRLKGVSLAAPSPPSLCQYSSGTTGKPKLIVRPWTEIEQEMDSYNQRLDPSGSDTPLIAVPVTHSFGLIAGMLAGLARGTVPRVITDKNPKYAMKLIRESADSIVYAVPFLYQLFGALGKGDLRYRKLVSSGAPLTEALLAQLVEAADEVWQQYGCSEIGCIALGSQPTFPDDVGAPLPHLTVTLESLRSEAADDEGEGYAVDRTDLSVREIFVSDRAKSQSIRTGDIGMRTEGGRLRIQGRLDDLINVSGQKVMPSEVERVLAGLPGIKEVVVYGTRHPVWGEAVKAMIVADRSLREDELRTLCGKELPGYKVPAFIETVDEIPRPASGKTSRRYIREREGG